MGNRVLIVDDEPLVVSALTRVLRSLGHHVEGHTKPAEALASAGLHPFDYILCDLHMPAMRGTDVLGEMKRRWPAVKRVMVSAFADDLTPGELEALSPCIVLAKPWSREGIEGLFGEVEGSAPKGAV